jgi:transposase InsO family protein
VHAPQAQQAANIDLCVVPVTHQGAVLPVGSVQQASDGLLPTPPAAPTPPDWAGQAFQDDTQPYEEQMRTYTTRRAQKRASQGQRKHRRRQKQAERAALNAQELELRLQRRRQRQRRRAEDHTWRARRATQRQAEQTHRQQSRAERRQHRAERRAQRAAWQAAKATRHAQLQERQTEDATWRQTRQTLREQRAHLAALPLVVAWYAILVVVDNGTRQCYGVPLFLVGVQVTADMVVAALRECLPPHLHFLISDNDARFLAAAFTQFLVDHQIEHVRIPPHHPCTNGIAERFVRTLKEWLTPHPWHSPEELQSLLTEFQATYNDRPHQGRELAGLSPNEFARRLADCSTS